MHFCVAVFYAQSVRNSGMLAHCGKSKCSTISLCFRKSNRPWKSAELQIRNMNAEKNPAAQEKKSPIRASKLGQVFSEYFECKKLRTAKRAAEKKRRKHVLALVV